MRFIRDLIATTAILAGVLILLELGLRLAGAKYEASLYTTEAERGYALRPNAEGWTTIENENYVRINSDGMYDEEHSAPRPQNVIRIAVIGSSEAEAQQVPLDRTFEAVIKRRISSELAQCGCRVEVLNFAVPGYGLAQEYLTLHNHIWKYQPQVVILANTSNVMLRNTRELYPDPRFIRNTPFYVFDHGVLVPDREARLIQTPDPVRVRWRARLSDWMNKSRVLSLVNEAFSSVPRVMERIKALRLPRSSQPVSSKDIPSNYTTAWTYNPGTPRMHESWAIGDGFFRMMKDDCDRHSAEFWIVTIEMEGEVSPNLADRYALERRLGVDSLLLSDQYIEELAHNNGIKVVTLAPSMGDYALSHHVALHGFFNTAFNDGHWNETGHQVAGEIIAQRLLRDSAVLNGSTDAGSPSSKGQDPSRNSVSCACSGK